MAVSFIGLGNRSTQRKPLTCRKSLTNFGIFKLFSHNVVSSTPLYESLKGFELTTLVAIGTDCTGNCKSNYHTITATTAPHIVGDKLSVLLIDKNKYSFLFQIFSNFYQNETF